LTGLTVKNDQRPAAAAIAAVLVSGQRARSVYDHSAGKYVAISIDVEGDQVRGYDYARGTHMSGRATSVYDYGSGTYIQFRANGPNVSGYDYNSGHHFQARVTGRTVSFYDHEAGRHFSFSVS
jgi:hypothetical protein